MQFPFQNNSQKNTKRNPLVNLFQVLKSHTANFFQTLNNPTLTSQFRPPWDLISLPFQNNNASAAHRFDIAMSTPEIEERLAGVPVYALSNAAEEFVLVLGKKTRKSLGLFCFRKEDAEAVLEQMRVLNGEMREGSRVVAVALNKVFQLKVDGVAFRLILDAQRVANAIREKVKIGDVVEDIPGVPVFSQEV